LPPHDGERFGAAGAKAMTIWQQLAG